MFQNKLEEPVWISGPVTLIKQKSMHPEKLSQKCHFGFRPLNLNYNSQKKIGKIISAEIENCKNKIAKSVDNSNLSPRNYLKQIKNMTFAQNFGNSKNRKTVKKCNSPIQENLYEISDSNSDSLLKTPNFTISTKNAGLNFLNNKKLPEKTSKTQTLFRESTENLINLANRDFDKYKSFKKSISNPIISSENIEIVFKNTVDHLLETPKKINLESQELKILGDNDFPKYLEGNIPKTCLDFKKKEKTLLISAIKNQLLELEKIANKKQNSKLNISNRNVSFSSDFHPRNAKQIMNLSGLGKQECDYSINQIQNSNQNDLNIKKNKISSNSHFSESEIQKGKNSENKSRKSDISTSKKFVKNFRPSDVLLDQNYGKCELKTTSYPKNERGQEEIKLSKLKKDLSKLTRFNPQICPNQLKSKLMSNLLNKQEFAKKYEKQILRTESYDRFGQFNPNPNSFYQKEYTDLEISIDNFRHDSLKINKNEYENSGIFSKLNPNFFRSLANEGTFEKDSFSNSRKTNNLIMDCSVLSIIGENNKLAFLGSLFNSHLEKFKNTKEHFAKMQNEYYKKNQICNRFYNIFIKPIQTSFLKTESFQTFEQFYFELKTQMQDFLIILSKNQSKVQKMRLWLAKLESSMETLQKLNSEFQIKLQYLKINNLFKEFQEIPILDVLPLSFRTGGKFEAISKMLNSPETGFFQNLSINAKFGNLHIKRPDSLLGSFNNTIKNERIDVSDLVESIREKYNFKSKRFSGWDGQVAAKYKFVGQNESRFVEKFKTTKQTNELKYSIDKSRYYISQRQTLDILKSSLKVSNKK